MLIEGSVFSYNKHEEHFIKYFNRLSNVGYSYYDIKIKILPQIQKYYNDIVVPNQDAIDRFKQKSLQTLFENWKNNY